MKSMRKKPTNQTFLLISLEDVVTTHYFKNQIKGKN